MNVTFADTLYWVAILNPRDQWHTKAKTVSESLHGVRVVTTEDVLIEFLNYYAEGGTQLRAASAKQARAILLNINVEVVSQIERNFENGLDLYEARMDKGYSLTDCISMNVCRARNITDVLTHDNHFRQEGFNVLL